MYDLVQFNEKNIPADVFSMGSSAGTECANFEHVMA
jgi:hypothetical protein